MSSETCLDTDDKEKGQKANAIGKGDAHDVSRLERISLCNETANTQERLISIITKFPLVFEAAFSLHPELCPTTIAPCFKGRTGRDLTNTLADRIKELGCPQDFIDLLHLAASLTPSELEKFSNSLIPDEAVRMITGILAEKANMMLPLMELYFQWYACHWKGREVSANHTPPNTPIIR